MRFTVSGLMRKAVLAGMAIAALALVAPAHANEGGGHGGGGAAPTPIKFVVNLGNPAQGGQMLAVEMVLDGAAEVGGAVNMYKPKIQHEIILLLSGEDAGNLRTVDGKKNLGEKIKDVVNKVIKETDRTGVKEVLFTNFMIQ